MYGYNEYIDITPNEILGRITQEKIFEFILGEPFSFYGRYKSPTRIDTEAGCRFVERDDGIILFVDFGAVNGKTHYNCFGLLMEKEGVDLQGAIGIVIEKFGLPKDKKEYKVVREFSYSGGRDKSYYKNREDVTQSLVKITYRKKEYSKIDIQYWSKFLITKDNLFEDSVFTASYIHINNGYKHKKYGYVPRGLCYVIDFTDAVKVYQPNNKEFKWLSNCNENHIGNIDNLDAKGEKLVICKSYKDSRVYRNLTGEKNVIWFQSEGVVPSTDILLNLLERFDKIVIFYDNDDKGIDSSRKLAQFLYEIREDSATCIWLPPELGYKDIAEAVNKEGRRDTINILKQLI